MKYDKSEISNYRPISIEPILAKLFEHSINNSLRQQLGNHICSQQHGFSPRRSTTSNLACYEDEISRCFDENSQVHSIYTDFSRAFDFVCHDLLIAKRQLQYNMQGAALN